LKASERSLDHSTDETAKGTRQAAVRRLGAVLLRLPRYLQLTYRLVRDERLSPTQRALAVAGAAYTVSPIDAVPGFIPLFGQLDDLAVLLLSLRQALRSGPTDVVHEHLNSVDLSLAQLDADLRTIRAIAIWTGLSLGRLLGRSFRRVGQLGLRHAGEAWQQARTRPG
jgi:uncharacterized membrane protein YkvA (DUF1232 family)